MGWGWGEVGLGKLWFSQTERGTNEVTHMKKRPQEFQSHHSNTPTPSH